MPQQDNQHSNGKWTTMALAVLSSANAGTGVYILVLIFVSIYPLGYALLPPLKPSLAVKIFKDTVKVTITYYDEHESLLDGSVSIGRVKELRIEALTLKEEHFQAHQRLSLTSLSSWVRYANAGRKIWLTARGFQREIDGLKGELKMAVLQAKKGRARATRGRPEVLNNQDGDDASSANRSERPDSIV
ncbi:hypothetical protein ARMSODRAFT_1085139 [Armillaria solidipes]|uniref:Uncharacterized protein n=1 Tax=Armillaria solidipes TaxID=1076256 RepID=A0A2H3BCS5_9AGAR|nr:hypothetical protein ARMSODRAFT_1085139 [Armillaria solidipes]